MAPDLGSLLMDLMAERRCEAVAYGWGQLPEPVFVTKAGTRWDDGNLRRAWGRVRRRAHRLGVRPLKLHCARHTWATMALQAGRPIRWVADQLGHADPSLTLRVYAHAMPSDAGDLSFLDLGGLSNAPGRPYTAPRDSGAPQESRKSLDSLAPPARLELATRGLGNRCSIP